MWYAGLLNRGPRGRLGGLGRERKQDHLRLRLPVQPVMNAFIALLIDRLRLQLAGRPFLAVLSCLLTSYTPVLESASVLALGL